jgi:hypothetical protein
MRTGGEGKLAARQFLMSLVSQTEGQRARSLPGRDTNFDLTR